MATTPTRDAQNKAKLYKARSNYAMRTRLLGANAPETLDAKRELAEAQLDKYITEVVSGLLPVTISDECADRLASLLRAGGDR